MRRTRGTRRAISLAVVLLGILSAGPARAQTLIDFETLPDGTTIPGGTAITTQFAPVGVASFASTAGAPQIAQFSLAGQSGMNTLAPNSCCMTQITIHFASPVSSVSVLALDVGGNGLVLEGFDAGGTLVDSMTVTNTGAGVGEIDTLSVSGAAIVRVVTRQVATGSGDGYVLDDLRFTLAPVCGDGVVSGAEECDDGNDDETDACLSTCVAASCGDGFVQAGVEVCDDGNDDETDACLSTCVAATCGDGFVQAGVEVCDDGNAEDTDGCLSSCVAASCGDGFVQAGVEACDDGNDDDTDGCLSSCVAATCGDGFVHAGVEACDDGNADDTDGCLSSCVAATCGDGFVQAGVEACDDGNADDTDGCLSSCVAATCGDGFVQAGVEACDDGNTASGDGCSASCTTEAPDAGPPPTDAGTQSDAAIDADGGVTADAGSGVTAGGCGCRSAGGQTPVGLGALAVLALGLLVRRRRRR